MNWSHYWHIFLDENNAIFIAIEVGWTDLNVDTYPSSSFDWSETRVIFIILYVWKNERVHPALIAVKHALLSSSNTCGRIREVHPTPIAVKNALFSSKNTCRYRYQSIRIRLQWNTRYFHRRIHVRVEEWKKFIQLRLQWNTRYIHRRIRVEEWKKFIQLRLQWYSHYFHQYIRV